MKDSGYNSSDINNYWGQFLTTFNDAVTKNNNQDTIQNAIDNHFAIEDTQRNFSSVINELAGGEDFDYGSEIINFINEELSENDEIELADAKRIFKEKNSITADSTEASQVDKAFEALAFKNKISYYSLGLTTAAYSLAKADAAVGSNEFKLGDGDGEYNLATIKDFLTRPRYISSITSLVHYNTGLDNLKSADIQDILNPINTNGNLYFDTDEISAVGRNALQYAKVDKTTGAGSAAGEITITTSNNKLTGVYKEDFGDIKNIVYDNNKIISVTIGDTQYYGDSITQNGTTKFTIKDGDTEKAVISTNYNGAIIGIKIGDKEMKFSGTTPYGIATTTTVDNVTTTETKSAKSTKTTKEIETSDSIRTLDTTNNNNRLTSFKNKTTGFNISDITYDENNTIKSVKINGHTYNISDGTSPISVKDSNNNEVKIVHNNGTITQIIAGDNQVSFEGANFTPNISTAEKDSTNVNSSQINVTKNNNKLTGISNTYLGNYNISNIVYSGNNIISIKIGTKTCSVNGSGTSFTATPSSGTYPNADITTNGRGVITNIKVHTGSDTKTYKEIKFEDSSNPTMPTKIISRVKGDGVYRTTTLDVNNNTTSIKKEYRDRTVEDGKLTSLTDTTNGFSIGSIEYDDDGKISKIAGATVNNKNSNPITITLNGKQARIFHSYDATTKKDTITNILRDGKQVSFSGDNFTPTYSSSSEQVKDSSKSAAGTVNITKLGDKLIGISNEKLGSNYSINDIVYSDSGISNIKIGNVTYASDKIELKSTSASGKIFQVNGTNTPNAVITTDINGKIVNIKINEDDKNSKEITFDASNNPTKIITSSTVNNVTTKTAYFVHNNITQISDNNVTRTIYNSKLKSFTGNGFSINNINYASSTGRISSILNNGKSISISETSAKNNPIVVDNIQIFHKYDADNKTDTITGIIQNGTQVVFDVDNDDKFTPLELKTQPAERSSTSAAGEVEVTTLGGKLTGVSNRYFNTGSSKISNIVYNNSGKITSIKIGNNTYSGDSLETSGNTITVKGTQGTTIATITMARSNSYISSIEMDSKKITFSADGVPKDVTTGIGTKSVTTYSATDSKKSVMKTYGNLKAGNIDVTTTNDKITGISNDNFGNVRIGYSGNSILKVTINGTSYSGSKLITDGNKITVKGNNNSVKAEITLSGSKITNIRIIDGSNYKEMAFNSSNKPTYTTGPNSN